MKLKTFGLAIALGLITGCSTNEERFAGSNSAPDFGTEFSHLPPPVQKTLREQVPNANIDDIDLERRTGRNIYEITLEEPGKNPKIHIAEDGTIVKIGDRVVEKAGAATDSIGVEFGELPLAVQRTIQQRAPHAKIDDIDKETRTGRTVYEITFEDPGKNEKLHVAEDGTIVQDIQ